MNLIALIIRDRKGRAWAMTSMFSRVVMTVHGGSKDRFLPVLSLAQLLVEQLAVVQLAVVQLEAELPVAELQEAA